MNYELAITKRESRIDKWDDVDYTTLPIEDLLPLRENWTSIFSFLGEKEAVMRRKYLLAEKARKRAFMEAKIKHIESGMTATKAESHAELDIQGKREHEIEMESEYHLYRNRRESAKEIISSLGQLIGVVRQEREQTQFQKG